MTAKAKKVSVAEKRRRKNQAIMAQRLIPLERGKPVLVVDASVLKDATEVYVGKICDL